MPGKRRDDLVDARFERTGDAGGGVRQDGRGGHGPVHTVVVVGHFLVVHLVSPTSTLTLTLNIVLLLPTSFALPLRVVGQPTRQVGLLALHPEHKRQHIAHVVDRIVRPHLDRGQPVVSRRQRQQKFARHQRPPRGRDQFEGVGVIRRFVPEDVEGPDDEGMAEGGVEGILLEEVLRLLRLRLLLRTPTTHATPHTTPGGDVGNRPAVQIEVARQEVVQPLVRSLLLGAQRFHHPEGRGEAEAGRGRGR
mmetsp:Transcript_14571/g.41953  ORF Transcript_14571/g.41953 Transcript_14571/m.41953 type:complete len:249 (+) Transcript_14571:683-1429(+)